MWWGGNHETPVAGEVAPPKKSEILSREFQSRQPDVPLQANPLANDHTHPHRFVLAAASDCIEIN